MAITIRRATAGDVHDICRVFRSAVRELAKGHYSAEQVEVWSSRLSPDTVRDGITIGCVHVADEDGEVVGFGRIDIHSAELSMLFVDPAHARRGIGCVILRHLEQAARENGLDALTLRASLNALPFYKSMGFTETETITHCIDGVDFKCINMSKTLRDA